MKLFYKSILALAMFGSVTASQAATMAITNAKVHTVTEQGVLEGATVLIEDGKIIAINPENMTADSVIDAKGGVLTPGFISSLNFMGLVEVSAVSNSRDARDDKADMNFDPSLAFNPKTTAIPFSRKGGITQNVVASAGGKSIFSGQAFVVDMSGDWDSIIDTNTALLVELGAQSKGSRAIAMQELMDKLEGAKKSADKVSDSKEKGDAKEPSKEEKLLAKVISANIPLVVAADRASDILQLLALKQQYNLDLVLLGAADAVLIADKIAEAKVPVVMDSMRNLPGSFDSLHNHLGNAGKLSAAGVKVVLAMPGATHGAYGLRFTAGNAVANGMDYDAALAAVTANVADVFNLDAGQIAVGKPADLVLWSNDPFEYSTHVEKIWINGEEQSTESRQDKLRDRYMTETTMPRAYTH